MAEKIQNRYRMLFELRLLHHYWLDEGEIQFDSLSKEQKIKRLELYDSRRLFVIAPTAATANMLKNLNVVYKTTALGCVAAIRHHENISVPDETLFEFVVTVQDHNFFNYTSLTLRDQKIYEFYNQQEERVYRYKKNIAVLSNKTGTARKNIIDLNDKKILFLSQEFREDAENIEDFFIENDKLKQLSNDNLDNVRELGAKIENPVYIHQGDIPDIVPPDTFTSDIAEQLPKKGCLLSDDIPDNVFVLIRLQAKLDDEEFSLVDEERGAKEAAPVFDVRFKNRSTFWRYIGGKKEIGGKQESSKPLPLTYYGNAGIDHFGLENVRKKPSKEQFVKIEKDNSKNIKLVSEVFI